MEAVGIHSVVYIAEEGIEHCLDEMLHNDLVQRNISMDQS